MRYGKAETLALLDAEGIPYDLAEHEAVFTVEEAHAAGVPFTEYGDKNLFLRDNKKRSVPPVGCPSPRSATSPRSSA